MRQTNLHKKINKTDFARNNLLAQFQFLNTPVD